MNATETTKKKKFVVKKSSCGDNVGELAGCSMGVPVGRAVLEGLKTAQLYGLLQLKNVPGRSKIKKKGERIETLAGLVTAQDLAKIGVKTPAAAEWNKVVDWMEVARKRRAEREDTRALGQRLDEPVAGIDVHSKTLVVAVATPTGITWEIEIENTREAITSLVRGLLARDVRHVAMESTAEYWQKACWLLQEAGISVLVANAAQVAATQGVKTDRVDARRLALAFRDGRLAPSVLCTPVQFQMRKLCRDAKKMTVKSSSALVRAGRILKRHEAPAWLEKPGGAARTWRILTRLLSPGGRDDMLSIITEEYSKYSGKITDETALAAMAGEARALLDSLDGTRECTRLLVHLRQYNQLQADAVALENEALVLVANDEKMFKMLKIVLSFPSVGLRTALAIVVEILDIDFFHGPKALVKWAGLAPRVNQSGYKKRATGKLYKRGNKYLRTAAYMAAMVDHTHHAKEGHPIGAYVHRLKNARQKHYKTAVAAGGAKLLHYIYVALVLEKEFQEVFIAEECAALKDSRERKKKELAKRIRKADPVDVLVTVARDLHVAEERLDAAIELRLNLMAHLMLETASALEQHS